MLDQICLKDLMLFVVFTVLIGYVPPFRNLHVHPYAKFCFSLLSIVPLAYYIGMALSSISAQTSLAVGAVLNATFGSIIELILFFNALGKGFTELTVAAVTGGLLGNMLLLPGLSMIVGGIKYRNQVCLCVCVRVGVLMWVCCVRVLCVLFACVCACACPCVCL